MTARPRQPASLLAAFAVALLSSTSLHGVAVAQAHQPASAAARLAALNDQLVAGIGAFHRAQGEQRQAAAAKLRVLARQRREALQGVVEHAPETVVEMALPNGMSAGLPTDVAELIEKEVDLSGHVGVLIADDPLRGASQHTYFLETDGPRAARYRLRRAGTPGQEHAAHPAARFVGQPVTVRGVEFSGQLLLASDGSIESTGQGAETLEAASASAASAAITGTQSTLVLLGNLRDKALDASCTPSLVNAVMFGATNSVNDVYRQSSNGAVSFSGPVYGPFQMSSSSASTDFWAIGDEMDRLAAAQGINVRNYSKTVYVIPRTNSGFIGVALINVGSAGAFYRSWIMACNWADVYAHELGHLVGFSHSATPGNEYGDTSDIMGSSALPLRQFSAPRKVQAGWIPAGRTVNVTGPGTFTLDATAATNPSNPQALIVAKPDTHDQYVISFRQPIGYDAGLASNYLNRVSIHRATAAAGDPTYLLATLGAGQTYTDSVNGYQFAVSAIGASTATVSINMPAAACVRAAPGLSLSPKSQSAAPGKAVSYQVTLVNNNNSACGTSTFSFASQVPPGWNGSVSPYTASLAAGQSTTATWTVTSPPTGVSEQSYAIALTASDAAAPNFPTTVQGSYLVTVADAIAPTVALTSPVNGTAVSGNVTLAASATDNRGVAKVEFWVNGKLVGTDSSAPYSYSWNTKKLSGTQTITARAFDAAGNVATSAPVSVTVGSTTGTGGGNGGNGGGKGNGKNKKG